MRKTNNAYEKGRSTYLKGKFRKPSDDRAFMALISEIVSTDGVTTREAKAYEINEWKRGWDEAKSEAEKPVVKKKSKKRAKK